MPIVTAVSAILKVYHLYVPIPTEVLPNPTVEVKIKNVKKTIKKKDIINLYIKPC